MRVRAPLKWRKSCQPHSVLFTMQLTNKSQMLYMFTFCPTSGRLLHSPDLLPAFYKGECGVVKSRNNVALVDFKIFSLILFMIEE